MGPLAIVVRAAGTNCDAEMVRGFTLAGARVEVLHLDALLREPARLEEADLIGLAGGFSYGDDCGAGRVQAVKLREGLMGGLRAAVARGALVLGACNGFQVLVQTGLLPGWDASSAAWNPHDQSVALAANAGGRFIDAWVRVVYEASSVCVWTRGLAETGRGTGLVAEASMLPIAHGEGRFVASSDAVIARLESSGQVALRYADNENGSMGAIAGVCDPSGRVLGLMPHPERFLSWQHHPWWTRLDARARGGLEGGVTPGLRMFQNAVSAARVALV